MRWPWIRDDAQPPADDDPPSPTATHTQLVATGTDPDDDAYVYATPAAADHWRADVWHPWP